MTAPHCPASSRCATCRAAHATAERIRRASLGEIQLRAWRRARIRRLIAGLCRECPLEALDGCEHCATHRPIALRRKRESMRRARAEVRL